MAKCKTCKGKGYLPVKDDVWKHLTGRGKPPKVKACHRCKGSGETSSSGSGCLWTLLVIVAIIAVLVVIAPTL